jgi:tetratricopeptide (TPR) repeat protein
MTLARAAYEALPTDARGDYRLTVVSRLVWEFYSSGRLDEAIAMSESELADPELMNSLLPAQQVDAYRTRAALLRYVGREEESRTLLDQAAEVVRTSTDMPPMPGIMLLWDIAVAHHGQGRLDEAFRNMTASNDGYFAERQKVASASASGQAAQKNEDLIRAQTEADIGWALYQELSKTPTALP